LEVDNRGGGHGRRGGAGRGRRGGGEERRNVRIEFCGETFDISLF